MINNPEKQEEFKLVKIGILKNDNKIHKTSYRGPADYVVLTNKAAKVWNEYKQYCKDIGETIPQVFDKVITINDPIFNLDKPKEQWDIKSVKVGSNLVLKKDDDDEPEPIDLSSEEGINRAMEGGIKEVTLVFERKPADDLVVTDCIFEYKQTKNNDDE